MITLMGEQWKVMKLVNPNSITFEDGITGSGATLFGWTEEQMMDLCSNFALFQESPMKALRVRPSGIYTCPQIDAPFFSFEGGERIGDSVGVYKLLEKM